MIDPTSAWDDSRRVDCGLWLATVMCSTRKVEIILYHIHNVLREKISRQRPKLRDLAAVEEYCIGSSMRLGQVAKLQMWVAELPQVQAVEV